MSYRRVFILVWILLIAIVPVSLVGARQDGGSDSNDKTGNCAFPITRLDGERFRMEPTSVVSSTPTPAFPFIYTNDNDLLTDLTNSMKVGSTKVAIIIIDFFNAPAAPDIKATHGELVTWQTNAIVGALGASSIITVDTVKIPSDTINTQDLSNELDAEIQNLNSQDGITQFVINMSFAIVPCDQVPTEGEYTTDPEIKAFSDSLRGQILVDPLIDSLKNKYCAGPNRVVYVAASGNAYLPYPFYPAAWPEVNSVGALVAPPPPDVRADYSNAASFWEIGAYQNDLANEAIEGTSFAAPTHSVRLAIEMSNGQTPPGTCGTGELPGQQFALTALFINGEPNPPLIAKYEVNSDSTTWTLYLQPDARLADGSPPVDAVVQALQTAFTIRHYDFKVEKVDDQTVIISIPDPGQTADLQYLLEEVGVQLAP